MKKDTRYSTLTTAASRLRHQNLYSQRSALGDACATHVILWPASRHQNNFASKSLLRVEQDVGPQFDESSELTQFPQSSLDNTTQRQYSYRINHGLLHIPYGLSFVVVLAVESSSNWTWLACKPSPPLSNQSKEVQSSEVCGGGRVHLWRQRVDSDHPVHSSHEPQGRAFAETKRGCLHSKHFSRLPSR